MSSGIKEAKMKRKAGVIIAVIIIILAAIGIFIGVKGGIKPAVNSIKSIFDSSVDISATGKYSETNDSLITQELKDITYDRYVLWTNDVEDGEGTYYLTDGQATALTVYTEEVSEDALETLEGDDALTYEEVYGILADNIESGYSNVTETSREMIMVDDKTDAMTIKFYTNKDAGEDSAPYEHWITLFLYKGNLYYFVLAEPQEVSVSIEYNVVITSIICN